MATKTANVANADIKPKNPKGFQKGNKVGKQFTGKDDPRGNRNGQRNKAAVRTQAEMRDLYVVVLHERGDELKPNPNATNLETIVRRHVLAAVNGDAAQREDLLDRIWGKALQQMSGPDGKDLFPTVVLLPDNVRDHAK